MVDVRSHIGGTLPSAPNISLNASGSAEFAGDVQVGGDAVSTEGCYIGSNGTLKAARDDANAVFVGRSTTSNSATFQVSGDGTVGIGGTLPSAPNISLNADGSALLGINGSVNGRINLRPGSGSDTSIQIASGVQFGDYFQIFNDGTIKANSSGDADRDPNYTLDASDGSANFAGTVYAGGNPYNGTATGSALCRDRQYICISSVQ